MYNSIKLNKQSILTSRKAEKPPINFPILPRKIPPKVARAAC